MAYIDPNTGGMLFQLLAASFAVITGGLLFFSSQIRAGANRMKRFFRERGGDVETQEPLSASETTDQSEELNE